MNAMRKLMVIGAVVLLAIPAMAGVTSSGSSDASTDVLSLGSGASQVSDSLTVAFDGPASKPSAPPQNQEYQYDESTKQLQTFSRSSKHGGWDWDDWDWDDWDWDEWDWHDWDNKPGGVVPEPGSMVLLGMGLGALALRRRQNKK